MRWEIIQFDENYEVSDSGLIRRIDGRILKPTILNTGYCQVQLSRRKKHFVHRLVAFAFCDGFKEGFVVNHKNGIRSDNGYKNLEWVTASENHLHSYKELSRVAPFLGKFGASHNTSRPIISIDIKTGEKEIFDCGLDAVRKYGFNSSGISRACNGVIASHKGRIWAFQQQTITY